MKRRRLIAIVSVCTLLGIGLIAVVGLLFVARTDAARNFVQRLVASGVNGTVYVGRISGNPLSSLTIDTIAIRDTTGEMVFSSGKLSVDYDIRDLIDTRVFFHHVVAEHPYLHLRQYAKGDWNYDRILKHEPADSTKPRTNTHSWEYIALDSVRGIDASYILSLDWKPDDTLSEAARDNAIRHERARKDNPVVRTSDGYARTFVWNHANALLSHVRLSDPDSNKTFGRLIQVSRLSVNESFPPFQFRNIRGSVRHLGDSIWVDFAHWDLPASTGSAKGKIVWGSNLPVRYDLTIPTDSIALNDVNWVYPTLPRTGGGKMLLHIGNQRDVHVMEYKLGKLDMRSEKTHLIGEMTIGVGAPVLQFRDVNLLASPIDFDFIRTLNGGPLAVDWQGQIFGNVHAPGGPLTRFAVDSLRAEFRDAHVKGAVSRFTGRGGLDILSPLYTSFHDFHVDVASLDLRTIEYLYPSFPRLDGTISGTAALDSLWTDVRFRDADITHQDGPGTPSHVTGSGRITNEKVMKYDVALYADSLSFPTLERSPEFAAWKLKGMASGPISVKGDATNLDVNTRLSGPAGVVAYAGRVDLDSVGGYSAHGRGEFSGVNLSRMLTNPSAPYSALFGSYDLAVSGASASTLLGTVDVHLSRGSRVDSVTVDSSDAKIRFLGGQAVLTDTLRIEGPGMHVKASGSLALPGGAMVDSIRVAVDIDSIGSFRPYIAGGKSSADSLDGSLRLNGVVKGTIDSLVITGDIAGDHLYARGVDALRLTGTFSVLDALRSPHGLLTARFDSVTAGGLAFDSMTTAFQIADTTHGSYVVSGAGDADSVSLKAAGNWAFASGSKTVRLDSMLLGLADSRWALEQPSTLTVDGSMFRIDTLVFRNGRGGVVAASGVVPTAAPADVRVSAENVPLPDIDRLTAALPVPMKGLANLTARIGGLRDNFTIDARGSVDSLQIADVRIGRLASTAHLENQRATVGLNIVHDDKRVLEASADSLPLAVSLFTYDTLPGRVHVLLDADSADFALMQTLVSGISKVHGKMSGRFLVDGTWSSPVITGQLALHDAGLVIDTLGITLESLNGAGTYARDTLTIDSVRATSGDVRNNFAKLAGKIAFAKWTPDWLDLKLDLGNFEAYNRPELARVIASTDSGPVRLFGPIDKSASDTVAGYITVTRGNIFLPDPKIASKGLRDQLDSPNDATVVGAATSKSDLFDRVTRNLSTDLRIHLGNDVALTADYANIPLTGDLRISLATAYSETAKRGGAYISRLAPEGTLFADRGTYTIDFGVVTKDLSVEKGGTITFDRTADWNPLLNLTTRYNVRSYQHPDIPVLVDVKGRLLPSPELSFRTDGPFEISESDLLSYLITGQPDFAGQSQEYRNLIAAVIAPTVSSKLTNSLRGGRLGSLGLRFETANPDFAASSTQGQGALQSLSNALYSTRINSDIQLSDKVFFNLSAGLCQFSSDYRSSLQQTGFLNKLSDPFGGNLEYRLSSEVRTGSTLQAAVAPSTQALLCSASADNLRGAAPTPRQFSLSFLKYWRW